MSAGRPIIFFDWNCTLFDDIDALHSCTNRLLEQEGHTPLALEKFRAHYNIPFRQFYQNMGFDESQIDKMMNLENSAFHDHYEPLANLAGLRAGALEILYHAHTQKIESLILSNHIESAIHAQLQRLSIEHLIAKVLAYANRATQFADMSKGERLRRYIAQRDGAPGAMMIVGDTIEEIQIGRQHGLISVAITGGCCNEERLKSEKPDYVIHSLHELKPILEQRGFVA